MIDSLSTVTFLDSGPSPGLDPYRRPIPGPDIPTVVPGCIVFQTGTTEPPQVGADQVVTLLTILVPYETKVTSTSRARIGADLEHTYQVVGSPTRYANPWTGASFGGEVFVKLVEG